MPKPTPKTIDKYGMTFQTGSHAIVEMLCIRSGGLWKVNGIPVGKGLLHHYTELQRLLWPTDDDHRWAELALKELVGNRIVTFLGPASSAKTHSVAKFALMNYWIWPNESLTLVSSTEGRGLEIRIWGRMKDLFNRAKELWPELSGNVIDHKMTITTNKVGFEGGNKARVLTKGIICVPCSDRESGIAAYIGAKQERITLIGDEAQAMGVSIFEAVSNLNANPRFSCYLMGNPTDPADVLGRAAEPECGWDSMPEPKKTTVWKGRFLGASVVNFVGTDSPNFDYPEDQPDKFPYLTSRRHIREIGDYWGYDSHKYHQMCLGTMRAGALKWRIFTRDMAVKHKAKEYPLWKDTQRRRIYAVDAAYSGTGGDRCIGGWCEFGESPDGIHQFACGEPTVIPVKVGIQKSPEDQIAEFVRDAVSADNIPASDIFYDSTGRGTLGSAFARVFGAITPVPVEFGGKATQRPVRHDLFVQPDPMSPKRHKRCDEEYMNFVSELWFSARYLCECGQLRNLNEQVLMELCLREYRVMAMGRIQIESKSDPKAKERMGRSPDFADWFVTAVEGARQRGLRIERLGSGLIETQGIIPSWLEDLHRKAQDHRRSKQLSRSR
jgi:hypothetical protein